MLPSIVLSELKERFGGSLYVNIGELADFNFTLETLTEETPDFCPETDVGLFLLDCFNLELVLFLFEFC